MANRHKKRCFTSSFVREMQMQTMKYHYIPMMNDQGTQHDNNKCWQGHRTTAKPILVGRQNSTDTLGDNLAVFFFFNKTRHTLTMKYHDHILVFTQWSWKHVHTKIIMWMFLAVLFILVKILKQSICASVGKWISKLRHVQTMGYYSVLKKKK